jgi:DNA-binding response OmpR family regulator
MMSLRSDGFSPISSSAWPPMVSKRSGSCRRQVPGYAELPIILMSAAYGDGRSTPWLLEPGMNVNAHLGKPFEIAELLALVSLHARPTSMRPAATLRVAMGSFETPVRVLVASHHSAAAGMAQMALSHVALEARTTTSTADATAALAQWQPHLVLLDMDLEVSTIMQKIDAARLPVIGLTRHGDLKSKLAAYDRGVQDIINVPLAPEELLARVIALVRRVYGAAVVLRPVVEFDELEIDILNRTVRSGGAVLRLTTLEQSLLYLLASSPGQVVSRKEINNMLWGADSVAQSGSVDRQVRSLRARLSIARRDDFITTVPGRGFRFLATGTSEV